MNLRWQHGPKVTTSLFDHVITTRGITQATEFIEPRWPNDLHDPFLLPDMEKAVTRILQAVECGESIGIVGDYDMDGTPAAVLLYQLLGCLGAYPAVILPTRMEGYGFQQAFVDRLRQKNVSLIITVDCGIRDHATVDYAAERGIDVVVTDHHECSETLPAALAVINPKRVDSGYPFRELSGTAVAFKLAEAIIGRLPKAHHNDVPKQWLAWSLDLVCMATISDMVPLVDENRLLAWYGLRVFRQSHRPGLRRLLEAIELDPSTFSYEDIAYKIIPKCNASGRMENMEAVFTLLASNDRELVDRAVRDILTRSTQSQMMLAAMLDAAEAKLHDQSTLGSVILLADDTWHPGLTGLVAGRLAEKHHRPVGIFAGIDATTYRGSMRSPKGISLPQLLAPATDVLGAFGGHEQAAGLSLLKQHFPVLQERLTAQPLDSQSIILTTDGEVTVSQLTLADIESLTRLAPWGIGHPEPLWSLQNVRLDGVRWLKDGAHLKASVREGTDCVSLIYFNAQSVLPIVDTSLDIYGTVSINEFRGKRDVQFMVKGVRPHGENENALRL